MRFGLLQESEKLRLEPAIGAEPQLREGLEDEQRGEAAAPESVLPKGQNGLLRLMQYHLRRSGELFETRRQWLDLDVSDTGLCLRESAEVALERPQYGAGVADTSGQIGEILLEGLTAHALLGMLLDLKVGEDPAPDAGAVATFVDQISGRIEEVRLEPSHQVLRHTGSVDGGPVAVGTGLEEGPSRRQDGALPTRVENGTNSDDLGSRGGIPLDVHESLP